MPELQVNWPKPSVSSKYGLNDLYKFIQVRIGNERYIDFDEMREHSTILNNFLENHGFGETIGHPAPKGDGYEVYGMGMIEINHNRKTARFFGSSSRYSDVGGFDKSDLDGLRKLKPDWSFEA